MSFITKITKRFRDEQDQIRELDLELHDIRIPELKHKGYFLTTDNNNNIKETNIQDVAVVDVEAGSGIDVDNTQLNSPIISHADTSDQESIVEQNNVFISEIDLDDFGHITELKSKPETTYTIAASTEPNKFIMTSSDGVKQEVIITPAVTVKANKANDDVITLNSTSGTNEVTYEVTHNKKGPDEETEKGPIEDKEVSGFNSSCEIEIPRVKVDTYGHTNELESQKLKITMPDAYTEGDNIDIDGTRISVKGLSTVAHTNDYNDLDNLPTIPSIEGLASEEYVDTSIAELDSELSTVAKTNDYDDLDNLPDLSHLEEYIMKTGGDMTGPLTVIDVPEDAQPGDTAYDNRAINKAYADLLFRRASSFSYIIVSNLPTADPNPSALYLVKIPGTENSYEQFVWDLDKYDEQGKPIYVNLGPTTIDLTPYLQKLDLAKNKGDSELTALTQKASTEEFNRIDDKIDNISAVAVGAIPNPEEKEEDQVLKYDGEKWVAAESSETGLVLREGYIEQDKEDVTDRVRATIGAGIQLGETHDTAYYGDLGKAAYDHTFETDNPHKTTYEQIVRDSEGSSAPVIFSETVPTALTQGYVGQRMILTVKPYTEFICVAIDSLGYKWQTQQRQLFIVDHTIYGPDLTIDMDHNCLVLDPLENYPAI